MVAPSFWLTESAKTGTDTPYFRPGTILLFPVLNVHLHSRCIVFCSFVIMPEAQAQGGQQEEESAFQRITGILKVRHFHLKFRSNHEFAHYE